MTTQYRYRDPDTGAASDGNSSLSVEKGVGILCSADVDIVRANDGSEYTEMLVKGITADAVDASPARAGKNNLAFGYLNAAYAATVTEITINSQHTLVALKPIFLAATWEDLDDLQSVSANREIVWPTVVSPSGNIYTVTCAATTNAYNKGAVAVQLDFGDTAFSCLSSGKNGYRLGGLRSQKEAPTAPAITTGTLTSSSFVATVASTSSNNYLLNYADIYVFTTREEAARGVPLTREPDTADQNISGHGATACTATTTYGGGTAGGGGNLVPSTTYWVVAVYKDKTGKFPTVRAESAIVSAATTA